MRSRGPRLGDILERQGALGREQLLRALRNQKVVGGRLGTCLLEIDGLSEDALLRALAEQQGAPPAPPEDLRGIPDEVIEIVPSKVAKSNLAVPFRVSGTQVQVAMIDARDLRALDELSFVTGRRVVPHVTSEARLLEALEKYYGDECPARFGKLLDRLNRARFLWGKREETPRSELLQWDPGLGVRAASESATAPVPIQVGPESAAADAKAPVPVAAAAESATAAPPAPPRAVPAPPRAVPAPPRAVPAPAPARTAVPAPTPAARTAATPEPPPASAPEPAAGPIPLAEAEARLLSPGSADEVGRTLVEFLRHRTAVGAVFQIKKSEATGWFAQGEAAEKIENLKVRLDRPSFFVALREGAGMHRGPLGDLFAHAPLRALLGEHADSDVVALPLRVRERVVAVLLAVPVGNSLDPETISALQRVAAKASIALELCIMRKKLRKA